MPADDNSALVAEPAAAAAGRARRGDRGGDAALRRTAEDKPTASASRPLPWTRKPQFGLLVTASLVGLLGIPAALIALRNGDANSGRERGAPPRVVTRPPARACRSAGFDGAP